MIPILIFTGVKEVTDARNSEQDNGSNGVVEKNGTNGVIEKTTNGVLEKNDTNGAIEKNETNSVEDKNAVNGVIDKSSKGVEESFKDGTDGKVITDLRTPPFSTKSWSSKYRSLRNQFEKSHL